MDHLIDGAFTFTTNFNMHGGNGITDNTGQNKNSGPRVVYRSHTSASGNYVQNYSSGSGSGCGSVSHCNGNKCFVGNEFRSPVNPN